MSGTMQLQANSWTRRWIPGGPSLRVTALGLFLVIAISGAASPASANEPLEKQFYDYFTAGCEKAMKAEWEAQKLDANNPAAHAVMVKYCSCTSQAVVSYLNAGEIIAFATNPEQEPAASKMKPHFLDCQERARKVGSNLTGGG
jgi:hypothetical protein